eukprot:g81505.t1
MSCSVKSFCTEMVLCGIILVLGWYFLWLVVVDCSENSKITEHDRDWIDQLEQADRRKDTLAEQTLLFMRDDMGFHGTSLSRRGSHKLHVQKFHIDEPSAASCKTARYGHRCG